MIKSKPIGKEVTYFFILILSILIYLAFLLFYYYFNKGNITNFVFLNATLNWIGIFLFLYIATTWYLISGKTISLYTIFVFFLFTFNFGQPIMWALGIRVDNEIGTLNSYGRGIPTEEDLALTKVIVLTFLGMFHLGAAFCHKPKKNVKRNLKKSANSLRSLYTISVILSFIVIPVTLYNSGYNLFYSQNYGYGSLYYDENKTNIVLFNFIQYMFFPTLIGLLIGSKYDKKNQIFVYIIFFFFLLINLLTGDRGSWLVPLIALLFMSHTFYKKFNFNKIILYGIVGLISFDIINAITSIRNKGINFENFLEALKSNENPIVSSIFEMGNSMTPTLLLLQNGWDQFPYPNTYLYAILGMVTTKMIMIMGLPYYGTVGDWFSQEFLGINYGAGFSIISESLINFGPFYGAIFMVFLGYIIGSILYLDKNIHYKVQPIRVFIATASLPILTLLSRGQMLSVTKSWFFGVLLIVIATYILKEYQLRNVIAKKV